jgi:hypothetical protein
MVGPVCGMKVRAVREAPHTSFQGEDGLVLTTSGGRRRLGRVFSTRPQLGPRLGVVCIARVQSRKVTGRRSISVRQMQRT